MPATDSAIAELISRARAGNNDALGQLLDLHRDYLRGLAAQQFPAKLQGRIDKSDLVQQTCLSVYKQFGQFVGNDPAEFVAWLRLIHERNIQNARRDQLLSQKRAVDREVVLESADLPGQESTPSQIFARDEDVARLQQAMQYLPEVEREIVNLRYFDGWTVPQIASFLDLTADGVAWRLKCSMKIMKKYLKDDTE